MLVEVLSVTKPCRHTQLYTSKQAGEGDVMLSGRAANALHDPGNHVDLEPSEHAGRRNLRRKGQKRDAR